MCSLRYPSCKARAPYCHLWPVRYYRIFPHYLIMGTIFEKKKVLNKKCVFWFSTQRLYDTFLILIRTERDVIIHVYCSSSKVPVIVRFSWKLNFLGRFPENFKYQISWKFLEWEPSYSMRTDGWADMTKLMVAFSNFANAPKNGRRPDTFRKSTLLRKRGNFHWKLTSTFSSLKR